MMKLQGFFKLVCAVIWNLYVDYSKSGVGHICAM